MSNMTTGFGIVLVLLGVGGYFGTGAESMTALIPAAFGAVLILLGLVAMKDKLRMHAMHAAALIGVLGFGGAVPGVIKLIKMLGGTEIERPAAAYAQTAMALICAAFVVMCIRSFVNARKARNDALGGSTPA